MVKPACDTYSCKGALHLNTDVLKFVSMREGRSKLVCTCGISYRMVRADQCDAVQLIPILYGARYRNRFCALIAKGASLSSAAKTLRLSLRVGSRWALGERVGNIKLLPRREIIKLRAKWRCLVRNAPPAGPITAATKADPAVYNALWKNDGDWLRAFNRSHRSPGRTKGAVRLKEPTPDQLREAWRGLMSAEPPIMATRRAILQRAGFFRTMGGNRSFEPVLVELVECRPAYLERVISWLASLAAEQRLGDCDEAIRTAGLRKASFTREQRERIRGIELLSSVGRHSSDNVR
ncbi:TnsD family Tn7-like transposition protein [Paraburkholderia strydomiana]|uniref:TnsD family Tn7-like transposition protein n=1 Tax=Paraburkholderia strydomiana TaxID=1245417 RepID=UPI0038B72ACC